jgi:hypothetical protein
MAVGGEDSQAFDLRLRDQHPVEGIAVVEGQISYRCGMPLIDIEKRDGSVARYSGDVVVEPELSARDLDRDLPNGDDADDQSLARFDNPAMMRRKTRVAYDSLQQNMCIEQKALAHFVYSSHSGPSSSKSSAIQNLPLYAPMRLFPSGLGSSGGISRATTLPWRVTSTSSPASARLTSSENFALASAMGTFMSASDYDQNLGHNSGFIKAAA